MHLSNLSLNEIQHGIVIANLSVEWDEQPLERVVESIMLHAF